MLVALVGGVRCAPAPGLKGICPSCGQAALAKCGPTNAWHWSHKGQRHCDPWWDNETDWHRGWKQCFDIRWQEIPRWDDGGEKHVADVKTSAGMVLEFQNSPMTIEEMQSRERFYEDMVWVVNARLFRDSLAVHVQPLPPPEAAMLSDVMFASTCLSSERPCFAFFRPSTFIPDLELQELFPVNNIRSEIEQAYCGHHPITWRRPREVWLEATKPVILDTGRTLLELVRYDNHGNRMYGARHVRMDEFLSSHGGRMSPLLHSMRDR